MDAIGVLSSWVTALMKLSCCSLRRISRTRKMVFRVTPAMMKPKKMMPSTTMPTSRHLISHVMLRASASATEQAPSTIKNAMARLREVIGMR